MVKPANTPIFTVMAEQQWQDVFDFVAEKMAGFLTRLIDCPTPEVRQSLTDDLQRAIRIALGNGRHSKGFWRDDGMFIGEGTPEFLQNILDKTLPGVVVPNAFTRLQIKDEKIELTFFPQINDARHLSGKRFFDEFNKWRQNKNMIPVIQPVQRKPPRIPKSPAVLGQLIKKGL